MDRGAWWATVHGVAKSWTRLSDSTFTFTIGGGHHICYVIFFQHISFGFILLAFFSISFCLLSSYNFTDLLAYHFLFQLPKPLSLTYQKRLLAHSFSQALGE